MVPLRKRSRVGLAARKKSRAPECAPEPQACLPIPPPDDPDITEQECTAQARRLVINAAPAITRAVVAEAKQGSYLHARMLFEFIALTAAPRALQPAELSPIVKLLVEELQLDLPSQLAS